METTQVLFSPKEVVTALLRQQTEIKSGYWGLRVKFGLSAVNAGSSPADILPAAVLTVLEIGLQRFDQETNISVDAATVNDDRERAAPKKTRERRASSKRKAG